MVKGVPTAEELADPEQARMKQEFIDEHVVSNIKFRNQGLHGIHRGSAFLVSALAVLDIEWQQMFGNTTTEEQFVGLARHVYQQLRQTQRDAMS